MSEFIWHLVPDCRPSVIKSLKGWGWLPYGEKTVDTHSTSLSQPTQIFTFAHSIVKHRQKSGFRRQENNRLYRFFRLFSVGIRYFPVFKIRTCSVGSEEQWDDCGHWNCRPNKVVLRSNIVAVFNVFNVYQRYESRVIVNKTPVAVSN